MSDNLIEIKTFSSQELDILMAGLNSSKNIVFFIINTNYEYVFFNKAHTLEMSKVYNVEIMKGKSIFNFILSENDRTIQKQHYDLALNGKTSKNVEKYGFDKEFYYETKYSPVIVDKKIVGVSVISEDVTAREIENKRKKLYLKKYENVLYAMPQAYVYAEVVYSPTGEPINYVFLDANKEYEELFHLSKEEILGKTILDINPNIEEYWISNLCRVALTGEPCHYENYAGAIDKFLSTYIYSPEYGKFIALTVDVSDDYSQKNSNYSDIHQLGSLTFNFINHTISCYSNVVSLNILESKLLFLLIRNLGKILTYEELYEQLDYKSIDGLKEHVKVYIHRLRRKISMVGCLDVQIKGYYGKGYSFVLGK